MTKELEKNLAKIRESKMFIRKRYHVKNIGVFGSFARGEQKRGSDLDILVAFASPVDFIEFIRLENCLSEKIGVKVDLVTKKGIKSAIKKDVLKETVYA